MIKTGEKITVEVFAPVPVLLERVRALPDVVQADYEQNRLVVHCTKSGRNLLAVLDLLRAEGTAFGAVYSEPPTLNDVFLEITGKQLRD